MVSGRKSRRAGFVICAGAFVVLLFGASVALAARSGGASEAGCLVPKVTRLSVHAAERRISRAGCRVGSIRRRTSSTRMTNRVLSQTPHWGRKRAHGARVSLLVGHGPRKTATPVASGGGGAGTGGGGGQGGTDSALPALGPTIPRQLPPYIAYDGAAGGVWLIKPDGSDAHQVGPTGAEGPAWSPDASEILYSEYNGPPSQNNNFVSTDTYVMNADGGDQRLIMPSCGFMWCDGDFQWSPDGQQFAFTHGEEMGHEVEIANADGSDAHGLCDCAWSGGASFSPDGSHIAFDSVGELATPSPTAADFNIYVVKLDGTGLQQVTNGGGVDPSWSPDGNSIIYSCDPDSSGYWTAVCGITRDDPTPQTLYTVPINYDGRAEGPSWSPDGKSIIYACDLDPGGYWHGICEITLGDPAPETLYTDPTRTVTRPTWNATGGEIAFTVGDTDGTHQVALLSPSGGAPTEITHPPGSNWFADW